MNRLPFLTMFSLAAVGLILTVPSAGQAQVPLGVGVNVGPVGVGVGTFPAYPGYTAYPVGPYPVVVRPYRPFYPPLVTVGPGVIVRPGPVWYPRGHYYGRGWRR